MESFNKMCGKGLLDVGQESCVPCAPIIVGDMQGLKCMGGMTESCHSVWCKCRATDTEDGEGPQHQYGAPGSTVSSYEEMLSIFDGLGCEFKTLDFMLACAHISPSEFKGGRFTRFVCPDCGYNPTSAEYKADRARFNGMTDDEQKAARRKHTALNAHWNQELFMGPMAVHFGMDMYGADRLHLVYLNFFKHLFKYTIHEPLPDSQKVQVRDYLRAAGFYSYDAADDGDDPVKRWIGREVKRFLHEADIHIPFLLSLSSRPMDCTADTAACRDAAGAEEMDLSDDEFAATEEQVAQEAAREPRVMLNAGRWDRFLEWVRAEEVPWTEDSDLYRKGRALQYFNNARACSRDLLDLKPTMKSWVPHIACNIVPRQMVALGDSGRRSADACESFGALTKSVSSKTSHVGAW
jgi:hypothetical protein